LSKEEIVMGTNTKHALGWLPDYPDLRDYTEKTEDVNVLLEPTGLLPAARAGKRLKQRSLPAAVDLREWCSAVEDQLNLGSCTAQAGAGILEYYERKAFGRHVEASRLFLYKVTRNLMKTKGDTGAYLRMTMGAMVLFGVPPEEYWPYTDGDAFDREPPAFCYAFAENYKTIKYYRHDPPGTQADKLLNNVKKYLAAGHPVMFGFTVYNSIDEAAADGRIPFPSPREKILGGHAVALWAMTTSSASRTSRAARRPWAPSSSATPGGRAGGKRATAGCPMTMSCAAWPRTFGPF
jgi:C1A family cysteine protease